MEDKEKCNKLSNVEIENALTSNIGISETITKSNVQLQNNEISKADAYRVALQNTLVDSTWRRLLIPELKSGYMQSIWDFLAIEELKAIYLF